ncbi:MAG: CYTH domain-containing protein [Candidatus Dormibacteria bacterium]
MAIEREFKYDVAETYALPALDGIAGLRARDRGVRQLDAIYWDTDDLRLLRGGFGLRHRTRDGGDGTWTLKAGSHREGGAMVREETELAGDARHIPDDLIARFRAAAPPGDVHPVAHLRTARHVIDLSEGGQPLAELADDTVTVFRGDEQVLRFREVEVEVHGDEVGRTAPVLELLRAAGAVPAETASKYVRALRALGHDVGAAADE